MFCLIKDNAIVFGPAPWDFRAILERLIVSGCDLMNGVLYGPDKAAVCPFPDAPPLGALELPGFTLLPAVEVDEPTPEGQMLAGREHVILADRVELRPVWAEIPLAPPPVPTPLPDLTKLEFLALFTNEEKINLKALESTDPMVGLFWEEYRGATSIRLDDPRTIRAINMLADQGHLTEARKAEILEGA